jgi:hypothetical protein
MRCPSCMFLMCPVHTKTQRRWICVTEACDLRRTALAPTASPFPPGQKIRFPCRG